MSRKELAPDSDTMRRRLHVIVQLLLLFFLFLVLLVMEDTDRPLLVHVRASYTKKIVNACLGRVGVPLPHRNRVFRGGVLSATITSGERYRHSQTLTYIMMTYRTFTAGASSEIVTVANPAALTANACSNPIATLVPSLIDSIAGVPMSSTRKNSQSVELWAPCQCSQNVRLIRGTDFSTTTIRRRNHVWCEGNR